MIDLQNTVETESMAKVIDLLAEVCHLNAQAKGFHADHAKIRNVLANAVSAEKLTSEQYHWFESNIEQAEIARMHSELSEWLEGIRKGHELDDHLPTFLSAEVEAADVIIRVLDTCNKRAYRIGEAIMAKLQFNASRPQKHGKNS